MSPMLFVAALVVLALATQAGVIVFQHRFPEKGKAIEVTGATLNVLDIGAKDAAGPPIVLIHGASSNLEAMRRPLGDRLAARHRVILIDRPGHGWSSTASEDSSTPAAYLGDDATDEHAFQAIRGHGLSLLVRPRWRQTAAQLLLRPPEELLDFLSQWLDALRKRAGVSGQTAAAVSR